MSNLRFHRGYTLVELMIALGVSAVVIAGVVGAALAQQRAFYGTERARAAQASGRAAQLFLEEKVRVAGFGMDPALAFDFQFYTPANYPSLPCPAEAAGCPRDAVNNNDELVFYERNPNYWVPADPAGAPVGHAWRVCGGPTSTDNANAITSGGVDIAANAGDSFKAGQILTAVCPNGRYYVYLTVASNKTFTAAGCQTLPLAVADATNPFKRQDLAVGPGSETPAYFNSSVSSLSSPPTASSCFRTGQARLFQVDRYRFHIRPVAVGSWPLGKTKYDPYLMLDMGVDTNGDGAIDLNDELVVAEGVEIMQVAYVMANSALPTPTVGTSSGTAIKFQPGLPGSTSTANEITTVKLPPTLPLTFAYAPSLMPIDNPYAVWSWYPYSTTPPLPANHPRMTDSLGNIRLVQIALVVRSPEPDAGKVTNLVLDDTYRLFNLNVVPSWISANAFPSASVDGYQRVQVQSTVLVPNMTARGMPYF
jgi:type IV pilus assembly protein PilW